MVSKIHVAFLTPEYVTQRKPEGGIANYIRKVGKALVQRGCRVSVFCLSGQRGSWQDGGIAIHAVKRWRVPYQLKRLGAVADYYPLIGQIVSSRLLARTVWRVHRVAPIDIIQTPNYELPALSLLGNKNIPIVCRVSSYSPLLRSAGGQNQNLADCLGDWFEVRQALAADAAFAPSQFMASIYCRIEGHKLRVIRTPLDSINVTTDASFYRKHLRGQDYLLYFGTLNAIKGVDLLAEAMSPILAENPDLKFVFIGPDHGLATHDKVFDYIVEKNLACRDRLFYHSALTKAQLYPVIANAHGVLMPSRVDNYPNACLEAQQLGVPVVGTYDSSLDEMIVDGETGFLAVNNNVESLKKAIQKLLRLSDADLDLMKQSILLKSRDIEKEERVEQLLGLYESVMNQYQRVGCR